MDTLLKWRSEPRRKALTISGNRQIGKTYIIDQFCRENYRNYLRLDFSTDVEARRIFRNFESADDIFQRLSLNYRGFIPTGDDTILFLDEIQNCPDARSALKPLILDGRTDVITSGSLLTVSGLRLPGGNTSDPNSGRARDPEVGYTDRGRDRVSSMGYERMIRMYAMDFEEYLWALGIGKEQTDRIRATIGECRPFDETALELLNKLYRRYLVVGGMPEVVSASLESTLDWDKVSGIQRDLRMEYASDVVTHCPVDMRDRVAGSINAIPVLLGKTNKKFIYKEAEGVGNVGWREYRRPIDWIGNAGMASLCWNVSEPVVPLVSRRNNDIKMYHFDTGLLINAYESPSGHNVASHILDDDIGINQGAIVENSVANMLERCGYDLHYYEVDRTVMTTEGSEKRERIEINFVLDFDDGLVAIEVKSGKNRRSGSLNKLMTSDRYSQYNFKRFIKFGRSNVRRDEDGVEHYPLFAAAFIDELDEHPDIVFDDIGELRV